MTDSIARSPIVMLGADAPSGAYVLHIGLDQPRAIVFGRYREGQPLPLPAGEYLYVGSAMGQTGSTTLARRLLRHASRSGGSPPHSIQGEMLDRFYQTGLSSQRLAAPRGKRCHWHVDYLLDDPHATLVHVLVIRAEKRLEGALAVHLQDAEYTSTPASGLGAGDAPGQTHLLRLEGSLTWEQWVRMMERWVAAVEGL